MFTDENRDNEDVNETRSNNGEGVTCGRYPDTEQCSSGRHVTTAKVKWNKELTNSNGMIFKNGAKQECIPKMNAKCFAINWFT